ncbi:MAG: hypothetical protein COZ49_01820 [Candidatus Yonathbacteria bacterium CG_4_10_14_3_um_filter_47_65]|uniref:phenylalanine--tRNA ligase n=2 Tax=Parcubacteria group TaxID=1794811 RepID=A0A2M8D6N1_9BACT|nr:MAG: hypothetical protein AUJ44_03680 [Candidatus Nomurabacteria bacterium CG1_02_47_685]PIP03370.1 MAG: hypothetical protein COX54_03955 [Candidatus Yonathbacteria bacterium CG23_combo_of_CG06-09_8_20_14_all_46_18]PIQ32600.1 MAG: hypothetical protein COW61_01370 [Candidatus Yonathbacteria bacterium CG17_big_fil_post_rev_8_21_14_2_50_46_19]PIX56481.1 MAG: hypothetical protein COZ49_01820 [Candidatus Yonathbacteria bacterium CG_4_10_14_3_um_filter_47_65]PIY57269.1 MAG: hypothetical protein CO
MLVSYRWLAAHFAKELPSAQEVAELLTMHTFEVESVSRNGDDFILDVDVLPNRAHDCLSHRGIAREIGAVTDVPVDHDRATQTLTNKARTTEKKPEIDVADEKLCRRYIGRRIEGVRVGPSPDWLRERLESIGGRSINNIVDITNYVMLELGQPLHAFDADKLDGNAIKIRLARTGEYITTLDGKDIALDESVLVIADDSSPLAIAGIKGGAKAEIDKRTTTIIVESANFSPANIRATARRIGIQTDSSKRFENEVTPELAGEAVELAVAMIVRYAAGPDIALGEVVDVYPRRPGAYKTGFSLARANALLGTDLSRETTQTILKRLGFSYEVIDPIARACELALTFAGTPYKHGASITYDAPRSFDCSSFVAYLFVQGGLSIPRMAVDQYVYGEPVNENNLLPGDVVFSNTGDGKIFYESVSWLAGTKVEKGVDHCGLYLGDGRIVHATAQTGNIVIETLDSSDRFKNITGFRRMTRSGEEERFVVAIPPERLDLRIEEDLIEEIGRIYGYRAITARVPRLNEGGKSTVNPVFFYANKVRNILVDRGFSEVYTYSFKDAGDVELVNPIASDKAYLRKDILSAMRETLESNDHRGDLLGSDDLKVFEIGAVFHGGAEYVSLCIGRMIRASYRGTDKKEIAKNQKRVLADTIAVLSDELGIFIKPTAEAFEKNGAIVEINFEKLVKELPVPNAYGDVLATGTSIGQFAPLSPYPFITRDIAVFVSPDIRADAVAKLIREHAGKLLAGEPRIFDTYEKKDTDGVVERISYAFRMVFQSREKTLTDVEVNVIMGGIVNAIESNDGWVVR